MVRIFFSGRVSCLFAPSECKEHRQKPCSTMKGAAFEPYMMRDAKGISKSTRNIILLKSI